MKRSQAQGKFTTSRQRRALAMRFGRQGGFSLIEVAIAMAIFVFGALAIVRIFPGALNVVQDSEQRAIGQRMAQSTLASFNAQPRTVPYALFDTNSNLNAATSMWSDFPGAVYGTNSDDNLSLAQAAPEPDDLDSANSFLNQSAMGHFRRVSSETHLVGANGEILLNFPYLFADAAAFNAALNPVIKVRRDVEGVTIDNAGALDFTNARLAGAAFRNTPVNPERPPNTDTTNYQTAGLATNNRFDVTFYVSYNWTNGGFTNGVQDEPKKFDGDASWTVTSPRVAQSLIAGNTVVPGPVKIWFYSSAAATNAQQGNAAYDPNLGRLQLPTLAGRTVSIDYTVPDWRFIVTDSNLSTQVSAADQDYLNEQPVTPAAVNARQVVLPTRFVADEPLSNNATLANRPSQVYTLLRGSSATGTPIAPIVNDWSQDKYDPSNPATPASVNSASGAVAGTRAIAVRPKTGQVFFDVDNLVSPSARVVYRNIEGWVQQPAIAAHFYAPYIDGADRNLFPREPWREYFYLPNNAESRIFFHASEAGKSLTVSYVYQEVGNFITMRDVPVPIEANVEDRPGTVPVAFNGRYLLNGTATDCTKISFAYLRDNQGRSIGNQPGVEFNSTARIIAISEVRGASIRVRSGWYNGDRYTQTSVVGYRPLDVESYNRS